MVPVIIGAVAGGGALVAVAGAGRHRCRTRRHAEAPEAARPSSVRVLHHGDELSDALRRAARSEREAADECRRRADRYEAQITPAPVTDLRTAGPAAASPPRGRTRSA